MNARLALTAPKNDNAKALYFLTNNDENTVAAVELGHNGLITGKGKVWKTGGKGGAGVEGPNQPAGPDALFSQSAITVVDGHIFVVNAGSNSVSMFAIDHKDPLTLVLVGKPLDLPGEFPTTVAASKKHQLVCVGLTGKKAGIACARFSAKTGLGKVDTWREIQLGQTTPPLGPTNTISQVFFSGDESQLLTTVKGDPPSKKDGFFSAYAVGGNESAGSESLSQRDVRSTPNGTAVLFGSAVIPGSTDVFVTDASFGAAVLSVDARSEKASVRAMVQVADQKATCWATISLATQTAFVTDVGKDRLLEIGYHPGGIKIITTISLPSPKDGSLGLVDLRAAGNFVYILSPGRDGVEASIFIVHAPSRKLVQTAGIKSIGAGKNAMGMGLLV
ncbi:hypothetical protein B0T24DRAFT_584089 [Lasiosphaeria ovina]|uniref:3-carboxymuconate cyclase n=1 Tax=Lasiosphaeria ovina TaxID=92902 RepID=A0AAE0N051_9PEZI|nr:hypothetical protein B0T24DRAFT_584089 [Lasiosphaeria ovina]